MSLQKQSLLSPWSCLAQESSTAHKASISALVLVIQLIKLCLLWHKSIIQLQFLDLLVILPLYREYLSRDIWSTHSPDHPDRYSSFHDFIKLPFVSERLWVCSEIFNYSTLLSVWFYSSNVKAGDVRQVLGVKGKASSGGKHHDLSENLLACFSMTNSGKQSVTAYDR